MLLFLISVFAALSVSFVCSLFEATLLSLTPSQIAEMAAKRPREGMIWQGFKRNIQEPIAVILILNTSAHTIGAAVAGSEFDGLFGDEWIWLFSLAFTFAMLQFTEILPKTLGVRYNRRIAALIARPLAVTTSALKPLLRLIHLINRPFEGRGPTGEIPATVEEITALAGLARLSNQISTHQERIIRRASRLSQRQVRDVMIPIEQVALLSSSQRIDEALITAHLEAHTRYPVCEDGDCNRVTGYVNFKELVAHMRINPSEPSLQGIIRPVHFVSPDSSAADLLQAFVDEHEHIAIVRDDAGRSQGLVTLEDVVEELLGELEDEFDRLPRMLHPLRGGTWMVGGGVSMTELVRRTGLSLPEPIGTVSAWLGERLQQPLATGTVLHVGATDFIVRRTRRGKVFESVVRHREPDKTAH